MREYASYNLDELGTPTAPKHARDYLETVSDRNVPREWEEVLDETRNHPPVFDEIDQPNSIERYVVTYEHGTVGPGYGIDVVDIIDATDQIVVSGEYKYFKEAQEILESENPGRKSSSKLMEDDFLETWEIMKNKLGV